jgi:hypothetical protein
VTMPVSKLYLFEACSLCSQASVRVALCRSPPSLTWVLRHSERMLHTRIKKWKIGRNHKFSEMCAAAARLAQHQDQRRSTDPQANSRQVRHTNSQPDSISFLIRGEHVSYKEFLRYFRRKKIHDPVAWVKEHEAERFVLSDDVDLIFIENADSDDSVDRHDDFEDLGGPVLRGNDPDQCEQVQQVPVWAQTDNHPVTDLLQQSQTLLHDEVDSDPLKGEASWVPSCSSAEERVYSNVATQLYLPSPLYMMPRNFRALEQLTASMAIYMTSYLSVPNLKANTEPKVHAHMAHAIFASKMQDGISILSRATPRPTRSRIWRTEMPDPNAAEAQAAFYGAFDMVRRVLLNHSPMSLALILCIVCELAGRTKSTWTQNLPVGGLLQQFLRFMQSTAGKLFGPEHPLATLFALLAEEFVSGTTSTSTGAPPLADITLTAMEVALKQLEMCPGGSFTASDEDWRALYIRERFCDALYHSGPAFQHRRSTMRKELLQHQERKYGPIARNVLWTMTNVADDCLDANDVKDAIKWFSEALQRAEKIIDDYGRAKTRFAALEGLGRCWLAMEKIVRVGEEAETAWDRHSRHGTQFIPSGTCLHRELTTPRAGAMRSESVSPSCPCHHHSSHETATSTGTSTPLTSQNSTASSSRATSLHHTLSPLGVRYLRKALQQLTEAEAEARVYFDPSSRRIHRISLQRLEVVELLALRTPDSSDESPELGELDFPARSEAELQAREIGTHLPEILSSNTVVGVGGCMFDTRDMVLVGPRDYDGLPQPSSSGQLPFGQSLF